MTKTKTNTSTIGTTQQNNGSKNNDSGALAGVLGALGAGIPGVVEPALQAAQIKDTSAEQSMIDTMNSTASMDLNSYDSLEQLWNQTNFAKTDYSMEDVRGMSAGQQTGQVFSAAGSGAMTGLQVGGPWGALIGAVVGTGVGAAGAIAGNVKARREASRLNTEGMIANNNFIKGFEHNTKNIAMNNKNEALLNIAAEGGYMPTRDFTNGMTFFSEGGSHEENPYQGIQQGIAPDGKPNLVEEGEWKYKDYVYSKRLKVPKKDYEMLGLKEGKDYTYADAAEAIQKESEERPNDPISIRNLDAMMGRLQNSQETFKQKIDALKMKREFEKLSPEEQAYMIQAMSQPQQVIPVQAQYAADGGHLFPHGGTTFVYTSSDGTTYGPREEYALMPYMNSVVDLGDSPQNKYDPYQQMVIKRIQENHVVPNSFLATMRSVEGQGSIGNKEASPLQAGYRFLDPNYRSPVLDLKIEKPTFPDTAKGAPSEITTSNKNNNTNNSLAQALRTVPAIGSGIGALVSMFDKPNYSNIKRAENMYRQIPLVSPKPIGNRMSYTPMDINYLMTQIGNQNIGNRRAIIESGAGNPGAVASALLAGNYKGTTAIGEAFRQANEYNLKQRQLVDEFNRGTDTYNADADFKGQVQSQERARILADAFLRAGQLRDAELAQVQANKSASISSFLNNMGNLGTDMLNREMVGALIKDGVYNKLGKNTSNMAGSIIGAFGFGGNLKKKGGKHA